MGTLNSVLSLGMPSKISTKSTLSKTELQTLVTSNDPSTSFTKPANKRSECWTNYSQIYHENNPQDYILCLQCRVVLKWTGEHGTRVMTHHNCIKKNLSQQLHLDNEQYHLIVNNLHHQKNVH